MSTLEIIKQKKFDKKSQELFAREVFPLDGFSLHISITLFISIFIFTVALVGSLFLIGQSSISSNKENIELLSYLAIATCGLIAATPWIRLFQHIRKKRELAQNLLVEGTLTFITPTEPVFTKRSKGMNNYPVTREFIVVEQNEPQRKGLMEVEGHNPEILKDSFLCPVLFHPKITFCVAFPVDEAIRVSLDLIDE